MLQLQNNESLKLSDIAVPNVPIKLRSMIIKTYSNFQTKNYLKEVDRWKQECVKIKQNHTRELSLRNAPIILSGGTPIVDKPVLPRKPYMRAFIPLNKLKEMVRHAYERRKDWDLIVDYTDIYNAISN